MNNNKKLSEMTLADVLIFAGMVYLMYLALSFMGWWAVLLYVALVLTVTSGD